MQTYKKLCIQGGATALQGARISKMKIVFVRYFEDAKKLIKSSVFNKLKEVREEEVQKAKV